MIIVRPANATAMSAAKVTDLTYLSEFQHIGWLDVLVRDIGTMQLLKSIGDIV